MWDIIIALAVALFVACAVSYTVLAAFPDCIANICSSSTHGLGHSALGCFSHFLLAAARTDSSSHSYPNHIVRRQKENAETSGTKLSIFKGREAALNRAIFKILDKEPKSIVEVQKLLSKQKNLHGTYYASVSKRIHCLVQAGYLVPVSQSGLKAMLYKLHAKSYLAIFMDKKSPEDLLKIVNDKNATIILSDLIQAFLPE